MAAVKTGQRMTARKFNQDWRYIEMLWTYDDNGYLVCGDIPEEGRCSKCGAKYKRTVENRKPWEPDGPDECPVCGHVCGHPAGKAAGLAFRNIAC